MRDGNPIPASSSQAKKITDAVRDRLPDWIKNTVQPILETAIQRDGVQATLSLAGKEKEKLILTYTPIKVGTGYAASTIQLEFGGRATGEPHEVDSAKFTSLMLMQRQGPTQSLKPA